MAGPPPTESRSRLEDRAPLSLPPGQVCLQVREGKGGQGKGTVRPQGVQGGGRNLLLLSLSEYQ